MICKFCCDSTRTPQVVVHVRTPIHTTSYYTFERCYLHHRISLLNVNTRNIVFHVWTSLPASSYFAFERRYPQHRVSLSNVDMGNIVFHFQTSIPATSYSSFERGRGYFIVDGFHTFHWMFPFCLIDPQWPFRYTQLLTLTTTRLVLLGRCRGHFADNSTTIHSYNISRSALYFTLQLITLWLNYFGVDHN